MFHFQSSYGVPYGIEGPEWCKDGDANELLLTRHGKGAMNVCYWVNLLDRANVSATSGDSCFQLSFLGR